MVEEAVEGEGSTAVMVVVVLVVPLVEEEVDVTIVESMAILQGIAPTSIDGWLHAPTKKGKIRKRMVLVLLIDGMFSLSFSGELFFEFC